MNKVSIINCSYNIEQYIGRYLEFVMMQRFKDIEIIIINDGSNDRTLSIIENYSKKDERIILINQNKSRDSRSQKEWIKCCKRRIYPFCRWR
ncbi:glycosyltransferase [Turicibacter bilis]|nr:glycosyltransferase [Turicibacter bilis]UUF11101.1 glycosyltransferase [Turicibacter bilis]